jgi:hypothetical protein
LVAYSDYDGSIFYFCLRFKSFFTCFLASRFISSLNLFGFFVKVRSARAVIRIFTKIPCFSLKILLVIKLSRKTRFVLLFEWETLLPALGLAPVSWQTRDIVIWVKYGGSLGGFSAFCKPI